MPLAPLPPPCPCQLAVKMLPFGRISYSEKKFGLNVDAIGICFVPKRNVTLCVFWSTTSHEEPKAVQMSVTPSCHVPPPTGGPRSSGSQMWDQPLLVVFHRTLPAASPSKSCVSDGTRNVPLRVG